MFLETTPVSQDRIHLLYLFSLRPRPVENDLENYRIYPEQDFSMNTLYQLVLNLASTMEVHQYDGNIFELFIAFQYKFHGHQEVSAFFRIVYLAGLLVKLMLEPGGSGVIWSQ